MLLFAFSRFPFLFPCSVCEKPEVETQHHIASNTSFKCSFLPQVLHQSCEASPLNPLMLQRGLPNTRPHLLLALSATEEMVSKHWWFKSCQPTPQDAFSTQPDSVVMQSTSCPSVYYGKRSFHTKL